MWQRGARAAAARAYGAADDAAADSGGGTGAEMADEGAGSATVREAEAGVHGDGALAAPVPAEAPKKRRRARSASRPRTSQDRSKMGKFNTVRAMGAEMAAPECGGKSGDVQQTHG